MSDREEQIQELEALAAVFEEQSDLIKYSKEEGELMQGAITVEFEPLSQPSSFYVTERKARKSIKINALPPAKLSFSLPADYPSTSAPTLSIKCIWMSEELLSTLHDSLIEQCKTMAGMSVLFFCYQTIIDSVREREKDLQEICLDSTPYVLSRNLSSREILRLVTDSSQKAEDHNFETGCYDCEVCFENKMGKDCIRLLPCNHVYCNVCVEAFVREKTRGSHVQALTCLGDDCNSPIPQPVIKRLIGEEEYERYERILLENALCQMSDVVTCPRQGCQRSVLLSEQNPKLGRCFCGFSFCAVCMKAYHGVAECDLNLVSKQKIIESFVAASQEERVRMSRKYGGMVRLQRLVDNLQNEAWITGNSKKCPKCATPIEKKSGCNKMLCTKCTTPFCWLCNKVLNKDDPYSHFRGEDNNQCGNRLFEGVIDDEVDYWDLDDDQDDNFDEDDEDDDDETDDEDVIVWIQDEEAEEEQEGN